MEFQTRLGGSKEDFEFVKKMAIDSCAASIHPDHDVTVESVKKAVDEALTLLAKVAPQIPFLRLLILEIKETGERIGYMIFHVDQQEPTTGEPQAVIQDGAVLPKYQGRLIWKMMMRKAEEIARERGNRYITGFITANNKTSLLLAKRHGFQVERYQVVKKL